MPLTEPRHSSEKNCEVYHNHTNCTESNNIEQRNFQWGTGGKRLCKHCEDLGNTDALAKKYLSSDNFFGSGKGLFRGTNSILAAMKKR
jgi:hypothetical protein